MFSREWIEFNEKIKDNKKQDILLKESEYFLPLVWCEHCVECSAPECYKTCSIFEEREDGKCKRVKLKYKEDKIEVKFLKWGKLESIYQEGFLSGNKYEFYEEIFGYIEKCIRIFLNSKINMKIKGFIGDGWFSIRQRIIHRLKKEKESEKKLLYLDISSEQIYDLNVELKTKQEILFLDTIHLVKGSRKYSLEIPSFHYNNKMKFLSLYSKNAEILPKFDIKSLEVIPNTVNQVKVVLWDLDNTIWSGVVSEKKLDEDIRIDIEIVNIIKKFDQKGIIQGIVSKNDYDIAWKQIEEFGLESYFIISKINWEDKSKNIEQIIKKLNVNLDSVAFVDDMEFERQEVKFHLPSVRCYTPDEIKVVDNLFEFSPKVTEDSLRRKNTYRDNLKRMEDEETWSGDKNNFLRQCKIKMIIQNATMEHLPRYYELLQRTNQLNMSGRRLSQDEIKEIIQNPSFAKYEISLEDKYGEYGIIGFCIVKITEKSSIITDLVFSCRASMKQVEQTFLHWLIIEQKSSHKKKIEAKVIKTERNNVLILELRKVGFIEEEKYSINLEKYNSKIDPVIKVKYNSCE